MAWFVVRPENGPAQMVTDKKLLEVVYSAQAEVRVQGFRSYEAAKCAVAVADAEFDVRVQRGKVKCAMHALREAQHAVREALRGLECVRG